MSDDSGVFLPSSLLMQIVCWWRWKSCSTTHTHRVIVVVVVAAVRAKNDVHMREHW